MAIALSIVVPVYNVAIYLPKCIDSLLDQDIPKDEYEILLINDGSTDDSGSICDEYAGREGNIRVIHQPNQGLSAARNKGIALARGEYVQFVDSDDYLQKNVLNDLLLQIKRDNLDVLRFNYQLVDERGYPSFPYKEQKAGVDYRDNVVDGTVFLNERLGSACYAWQFISRTDQIRDNHLFFKPGLLYEDTIWTPDLLLTVSNVNSADTIVYNYRMRNDSITRNTTKSHLDRTFDSLLYVIENFKEKRKTTKVLWFSIMIAATCINYLNLVALKDFERRKVHIKNLKKLKVLPSNSRMGTKSGRRKLFLVNISPNLFCLVLHFLHK